MTNYDDDISQAQQDYQGAPLKADVCSNCGRYLFYEERLIDGLCEDCPDGLTEGDYL